MVQYKNQFTHIGLTTRLVGTLKVEITGWQYAQDHVSYYIQDSLTDSEGVVTVLNTRTKRVEAEVVDAMAEQLLSANPSLSELPKFAMEWEKCRLALLDFIKQDLLEDGVHTIYGLLPTDWEYSPTE